MSSRTNIAGCESMLLKQFPYRLLKSDPSFCEFLNNTNAGFTEPFFNETISRLKAVTENQQRLKRIAAIEMLPVWANRLETEHSPTAILFHVSRCGSTLLSQLLALKSQHMVLSEVPFFDELLRLPFRHRKTNKAAAATLFHAALQLYVHSSEELPRHVFLKTDSWHLHFYQQFRELYPQVPFIFLYRNPWQVMQSQQRRRGMQSVPDVIEPAVFNFSAEEAAVYDLDRYMAQVLHSYFTKMISIVSLDKKVVLLNYEEGALAAMKRVANASGIVMDAAYEHLIKERSGFHGKYPGEIFKEADNTDNAPDYMFPTMQLYLKLEAIRLKQVAM